MILNLKGKVGPQKLESGAIEPARLGKSGQLICSKLHGKYLEQNFRGNVFRSGASIAPAVITSTNFGGYVANPINSRKYLSMIYWSAVQDGFPATPAMAGIVLAVNPAAVRIDATTFANAVQSSGILPRSLNTGVGGGGANQGAAVGIFSTVATSFPSAFTIYRPFINHLTGAGTTIAVGPRAVIEFDGTCLIAPGFALAFMKTIADTSGSVTFRCGLAWEEIPI